MEPKEMVPTKNIKYHLDKKKHYSMFHFEYTDKIHLQVMFEYMFVDYLNNQYNLFGLRR